MGKRIVAAFLLLVFVMGSVPAFAHDKQDEHDKDLKYVLFGSREEILSGDANLIFNAIADAAALTIDQFSPNDTNRWKENTYNKLQKNLEQLHLPSLKDSYDSLDLNIKIATDGKNITANTHRKYTHLGWNYKNYPNEEFWVKRKQVLLHTVNWMLFNGSPSEQSNAFCAMVYYIHILGDHIEGDASKNLEYLEPIQYVDASTPGIITELKEQLQIVFTSQKRSWSYAGLMEALTTLEIESAEEYKTWGKLDTKEKCDINKEYAKEILRVLSAYLPTLLKKEPFFYNHFK